jgi:hypothetical protein
LSFAGVGEDNRTKLRAIERNTFLQYTVAEFLHHPRQCWRTGSHYFTGNIIRVQHMAAKLGKHSSHKRLPYPN